MCLQQSHFVVSILMIAAMLNLRLSAQDREASPSLPRHAIVFVHHSDAARKDYDIWQIAADGTQMASVVVLPDHQTQLTISPNGDELIYVDSVNGRGDLWRRKFNGKAAANITVSDSIEGSPRWSPDGTRLLFSSDRDSEKSEIYVMSLDSREVQRLTNNELYESEACWAPDENKIIFTRFFPADEQIKSQGHGAIVEYDLKSHQERQLTDLGGYCGGLDFFTGWSINCIPPSG